MPSIVLHQFPYSHYNDKARWALAYKGLAHARRDYLPGPHLPAIRRLSGHSQTPVLEIDGEVVAGSAAIIDRLERRVREPALYPADPAARAAALDWQARLDTSVGPAVRTVLFAVLIAEPAYLCRLFAGERSALVRAAYRASFPFARPLMARGNGVDSQASIDAAVARTAAALDEVADAVASTGYLVGDAFSVADLSAAALLAPLCDPPAVDMQRPRPRPPALDGLLAAYAGHPAIRWCTEMYARHRP